MSIRPSLGGVEDSLDLTAVRAEAQCSAVPPLVLVGRGRPHVRRRLDKHVAVVEVDRHEVVPADERREVVDRLLLMQPGAHVVAIPPTLCDVSGGPADQTVGRDEGQCDPRQHEGDRERAPFRVAPVDGMAVEGGLSTASVGAGCGCCELMIPGHQTIV